MQRFAAVLLVLMLALAGCAASPRAAVQTLVAALPAGDAGPGGPLGGRIAALPTPDPQAPTPTPPPSQIVFPTPAPTGSGPLAALTAVAGLLPTMDLDATPYTIAYRGVPVFIEFQARW